MSAENGEYPLIVWLLHALISIIWLLPAIYIFIRERREHDESLLFFGIHSVLVESTASHSTECIFAFNIF